jgi:hypothetical protein
LEWLSYSSWPRVATSFHLNHQHSERLKRRQYRNDIPHADEDPFVDVCRGFRSRVGRSQETARDWLGPCLGAEEGRPKFPHSATERKEVKV